MCSVTESDFEEVAQCMEAKPPSVPVGTLCKKCNVEKAEVVLRVRDAYCRECFLASTTHKFRAVLGKSRLLKFHDNVLLAVSASQSSLTLLHLVKTGVDEKCQKRLRCTPYVIYIDEGAALGQSPDERQQVCSDIAKLIQTYEMPVFVSSLDKSLANETERDTLCSSLNSDIKLDINEQGDTNLRNLLDQVQSLTSKDDLIQKLRCLYVPVIILYVLGMLCMMFGISVSI